MAYMVKIRPPVIAVGDDKKRKGRKGKIHSHSGLYFSSRPRQTDLQKKTHSCRGRRSNHSVQYFIYCVIQKQKIQLNFFHKISYLVTLLSPDSPKNLQTAIYSLLSQNVWCMLISTTANNREPVTKSVLSTFNLIVLSVRDANCNVIRIPQIYCTKLQNSFGRHTSHVIKKSRHLI